MIRWLESLENRLSRRTVFVGALIVMFALHARALFDPPYWDALIGSFPQGVWLQRNGFDLVRLVTLEKTADEGGPNVYPFSLYPLLVGALYAVRLAPAHVFAVMHVLNLVCAAAAAAAFFELARRRSSASMGLLATLALASAPLYQSLAEQLNMDMPLAACTLLSLEALDRRRCGQAWAFALLALLVHPRSVILVATNLAAVGALALWPRALSEADGERGGRDRAWTWALAHGGLLAVFCVEVFLSAHYSTGPTMTSYVTLGGGFRDLFGRVVWLVPEYGVTLLLALVATGVVAWRSLRGVVRWHELHLALFVLCFVGFYGQFTNPLLRYFLQSYPYVFLLVLGTFLGASRLSGVRVAVLISACVLNIVNHAGSLYPRYQVRVSVPGLPDTILPTNDGHVLERSLEYREDLLLGLDVARYLERYDREDTVIVANWPTPFALALPELGYVERPWRTTSTPSITFDPNAIPPGELYDGRRWSAVENVVWVLSPNVYPLPGLWRRRPVDVDSTVLAHGRHRAFVVAPAGAQGR